MKSTHDLGLPRTIWALASLSACAALRAAPGARVAWLRRQRASPVLRTAAGGLYSSWRTAAAAHYDAEAVKPFVAVFVCRELARKPAGADRFCRSMRKARAVSTVYRHSERSERGHIHSQAQPRCDSSSGRVQTRCGPPPGPECPSHAADSSRHEPARWISIRIRRAPGSTCPA